ncbi:hypothetical protein BX600DRAFT_513511 [Xylariales sp. PMI_506]|nr:hypothetical protein BX600DRAFT_513511 [Xylariales sp. PMI_506]
MKTRSLVPAGLLCLCAQSVCGAFVPAADADALKLSKDAVSPPVHPVQPRSLGGAAALTIEGVIDLFEGILDVGPLSLFEMIGALVAAGLTSLDLDDVVSYVDGLVSGEASSSNTNSLEPQTTIYPQASADDAPYSFDESVLRSAIYIPETFQYGAADAPQPVLLVAGTGNAGYVTWAGTYIPLLQNNETSFADPVWLNIPDSSLDDCQGNAEFVAYAINYLSGICGGRQIAVFGYSQGNYDAQWAYKYWPSTRVLVTDHVAFSPAYHGTDLSYILTLIERPPAWIQADYYSDFSVTLVADGGDSAYVPTTNIYSETDEIAQPQSGSNATGSLQDIRGVGVSNNMVQSICPGQLAGGVYTHEGMMFSSLGYALAKDALANDGPGDVSRLDLDEICGTYLAPTLTLENVLLVENTLVVAGVLTLMYPNDTTTEPAIKSYASGN